MNSVDDQYSKFHLVREMMETPDLIRKTSIDSIKEFAEFVRKDRILLSGEGSSRIFPAGNPARLRNSWRNTGYWRVSTVAGGQGTGSRGVSVLSG